MRAPRQSFCRELPAPVSCREPLIGESLAASSIDKRIEPRQRVVLDIPFVESKRELIDIPEKMLFAGVVVNAMQPAFEHGPDALNAVRGGRTARIFSSAVV